MSCSTVILSVPVFVSESTVTFSITDWSFTSTSVSSYLSAGVNVKVTSSPAPARGLSAVIVPFTPGRIRYAASFALNTAIRVISDGIPSRAIPSRVMVPLPSAPGVT